jgi:PDZ domain-containing secreted protein
MGELVPAGETIEAPPPRRRRRGIIALVVIVVLIAAVGIWSDKKAAGFYAYLPGSAPSITTSADCRPASGGSLVLPNGNPCARLVIAPGHGHTIDGRLLMVDVLLGKATPTEWLEDWLGVLNTFHKAAQLIPSHAVLGSTPASQYNCQDDQDMTTAQEVAPVVALNRLGYKVRTSYLGARVEEVGSGTPASAAGLQCNDLIVAVDAKMVTSAQDLADALSATKPGQVVKVTVQRTGTNGKTIALTQSVTLGAVPKTAVKAGDKNPTYMGIQTYSQVDYKLPFHVSVEVGDIGGPSAGLSLTLALLDALSNGQLTGGHVIAATGTMSLNGAVGAIGGVKQKTVAVERAGAGLFLVPADAGGQTNYTDAKNAAGPGLKVEGVSSLSQALEDIKRFGGHVPPTQPAASRS